LSGRPDGRRTRAFLSLANVVIDHLPFAQVGEGDPFHLGMVKEQVIAPGLDEAETAIRDEPLDLTLWHYLPPNKNPPPYHWHFAGPTAKNKPEQIAQAKKGH
jgi:hypothetical protein